MYLRLKERYILRGWKDVPFALVDLETGNVLSFPRETYQVLRKCTGGTDFDLSGYTKKDFAVLTQLCDAGIVDASEAPGPEIPDFAAYRQYASRFIRHVHWSITGNCNYRCRHCYMAASECTHADLPFEKIRDIVCQMEECGILNVSLSGGEALVRPDFWNIVDELTARHIAVRAVYSNGYLINDAFFEKLRSRGLRPTVVLSFDGTGGAHDWLRGTGHATEHFMRAVRLIRENGLDFEAEFCAHRGNTHLLRESVNLLAGEGCKRVKVNLLLDEGNGRQIADYCLDIKEAYDRFLAYIPKYYEDGAPVPIILRGLFMTDGSGGYYVPGCRCPDAFDPSQYCMCSHAATVMYISASGQVLPCVALDCAEGIASSFSRVPDTPLKEILDDSAYSRFLNMRLDAYFEANPGCAQCAFRFKCAGGCRAQAAIQNRADHIMTVDRETCLLYKGGYYDRLRKMMSAMGIEEKRHVAKV